MKKLITTNLFWSKGQREMIDQIVITFHEYSFLGKIGNHNLLDPYHIDWQIFVAHYSLK